MNLIVIDWLADLYSSMEDDDIPLPPMNPLIPFGEETAPVPPSPSLMKTMIQSPPTPPPINKPEIESSSTPSLQTSQVY